MFETDKTIQAIRKLSDYTDKTFVTMPLREISEMLNIKNLHSYLGFGQEREDLILIGLNFNKPGTWENSYIHEILHIILKYENYPFLNADYNFLDENVPDRYHNIMDKLVAKFSSVLEHPEIYSRMESEYNLNMKRYFNSLLIQKNNRFNRKFPKEKQNQIFYKQQNILDGIEYFYYQEPYKTLIFNKFKEVDLSGVKSCKSLYNKIKNTGMHSPSDILKSGEIIKDHIIKFGKQKGLNNIFLDIWRSINIEENYR